MRNVAILVDGNFYINHHKSYFEQNDPQDVANNLFSHCLQHINTTKERLYRIFFYDCPPLTKETYNPLTGETVDLSKLKIVNFHNKLYKQLKKTKNLVLRLGFLDENNANWRINNTEKEEQLIAGTLKQEDLLESDISYYAQRKNIDITMGIDIASLAYKNIVNKIILITNDNGFVPAAKLARREGIEFVLDPIHKRIKADLQEHVDSVITTLAEEKPKKSLFNLFK